MNNVMVASCKYCIDKKTDGKIKSSLVRQKQIDIAEKMNIKHTFKKRSFNT